MEASFETFWAQYPRREAKKDAKKAWQQVNGKQHLGAILTALGWQAQKWDDPRYIPLPASYLRGERWEDEPPAKAVQKSPQGIQYECPHRPACASRWACGTKPLHERQAS